MIISEKNVIKILTGNEYFIIIIKLPILIFIIKIPNLTRKEVNFGKAKFVFPCSYKK